MTTPNLLDRVQGHERAVLRGFGALLDSPRLRTIVFEGEDAAPVLERAGFAIEALPKHHAGDNSAPNMVARRG